MLNFALAAFAVALVGVVPGAAVHALFRPAVMRDPILWFACAPPLSIGVLFIVAQLLSVGDVPLTPWLPVLVGSVLLVGCLLRWRWRWRLRLRLRHSAARSIDESSSVGTPDDVPARVGGRAMLLFVAVLVGLTVWGVALHGQPDAPPSRDGLYHGFFVKRIADTGSVDTSRIVVTDPVTEEVAASFYPLALHNAVALGHRLTGVGIGLLLTAWTVAGAAVFLPAGMFVLVRRLVPKRPHAAGFSALVVPFFAMFPYRPATWSAITLLVGLALTPVVLVLLADAVEQESSRSGRIGPAVLATFGVISTHTSQLALILVLVAIIEAGALWRSRRERQVVRRRVVNLLTTAGVVFALYVPSLVKLGSAAAERAAFSEAPYLRLAEAIGGIADFSFAMPGSQQLLGGLVVLGIWLSARDRCLGAWTLCLIATIAVFLATVVTGGLWHQLRPITQPWYFSGWRTSYQVALVASVFAGYALAVGASLLDATLRPVLPALRGRSLGSVVVAGALVALGSMTLLRQPVDIVRFAYSTNARTTGSMVRAFDYLAGQAGPQEVILNEERDGSAWMYADSGLRPLLAVYQYVPTGQTLDRIHLATHIADYSVDARVRELVQRWNIHFVLVSDVGFVDEPPRVTAADLADDPAFRKVFEDGGIHIFRVSDQPLDSVDTASS